MDVEELLHQWRERRREILKTLPPKLLAEYRQLGRAIHLAKMQVNEIGPDGGLIVRTIDPKQLCKVCDIDREPSEEIMQQAQQHKHFRVALSRRKETLIKFLAERGPSTRGEILRETDIPPGSLSMLLQRSEFENVGHGLWRLREVPKKK